MKVITEKELCEKFIAAHPRKEHVYFEVHVPSGRCDIVHKETTIVTIYEAKLRLSVDLLEQCINRKSLCHFIYAVVPETIRRNSFMEGLFRDYGIGIITLRNHGFHYDDNQHDFKSYREIKCLWEIEPPKLNRHPESITLYEENKKEIAGSQQGGITPFAIMVKNIQECLRVKGKCTIEEAFRHQSYYGGLKQFKTNIYAWIRRGVIKGIEMEKGMMWLTPKTESSK